MLAPSTCIATYEKELDSEFSGALEPTLRLPVPMTDEGQHIASSYQTTLMTIVMWLCILGLSQIRMLLTAYYACKHYSKIKPRILKVISNLKSTSKMSMPVCKVSVCKVSVLCAKLPVVLALYSQLYWQDWLVLKSIDSL